MSALKIYPQQAESRLITTLFDNSKLIYAQGRFDDWCIYHVVDGAQHAIKDIEVFSMLYKYSNTLERFKIYTDFVTVFNKVTSQVDYDLILKIKEVSMGYMEFLDMEFVFSFLYAGMVAEENKRNAVIKKYIKRLGVHQVLIEGVEPKIAAAYSKGKKWRELKLECEARGFYTNKNIQRIKA